MEARRVGARIVIDTDAHRVGDLSLMRYGVEQARRAWLEKKDVLNTLPVSRLLKALHRARA
jgi:DNA polymerase (family 10)